MEVEVGMRTSKLDKRDTDMKKEVRVKHDSSTSTARKIVKVDGIKLDKFYGDMRKYPQFKEDFQIHIQPHCTPEQVVFVLKSHLTEEIKEEIDNVGNIPIDAWERLDIKYGNVDKIVDLILNDLKNLPRGDNSDPLRMISLVEKAYPETYQPSLRNV